MKKKTLKKLAAFTLAATMLAGCSGSSTSTTTTTAAGKVDATTKTEEAATETTAAVEEVNYKEHVVIGIGAAIEQASPHEATNVQTNMLCATIYNTLLSLNYDTQEIEPELATEWKWVDDVTLEVKLRDDVTFHDGSKFTADDVVFTFNSLVEKNISQVATLDKVEKVDDYNVRMTLKQPNVDWLNTLSTQLTGIVSKTACEADPENGFEIGSGPFKLEKLVASDYADVVRYDDYWGGAAKTEKISFRTITEGSARVIALQNGELDVCLLVPDTEIQYIAEDSDLELIQYAASTCRYLGINTSKEPGSSYELRRALAHCINVDDIIAVAVNGNATPAISYWSPSTYGYYNGFGPYEQDLELAKEYLAKAFPNGDAKIKITTPGAEYAKAAQVIQEQARAIGLTVEVETLESATMSAISKYADPQHEAILYSLAWKTYADDCRRPYYNNSNTNKAHVTDERVWELIDLAVGEFDDAKRKEYYKELQELNHENVWYIPLYHPTTSNGINKNLSGAMWDPAGNHDFSNVYVTEE